jgi:hypothetical protein
MKIKKWISYKESEKYKQDDSKKPLLANISKTKNYVLAGILISLATFPFSMTILV